MREHAKARSRHYILSGALGGLVGFLLMEALAVFFRGGDTRADYLVHMALYFAGFGLAVGAALGLTEGLIARDRWRLWYGLIVGLLLGAVGGFCGGLVGQAIYGLVPLRYARQSNADLVIALDSSGSMRQMFFLGNDPWGRRKKAAKQLVDRLSTGDRVAVVDFDDEAEVLLPLTPMASAEARRRARQAVGQVDNSGGTNLDAGLSASLGVLDATRGDGRDKHVIFLTDGQGAYTPDAFPSQSMKGVVIHTVGLGSSVDADLLTAIAGSTGGKYYPVADAAELVAVFEQIFSEQVAMTDVAEGDEPGELLTPAWILVLLRILSWGAMGLAIGAGQGVRENTREDFRACALGGLIGGGLGGALFDPVSELTALGAGLVGRALADVVVGAMIGGSIRLAQRQLVEASGKPTTTLLSVLPKKHAIVRVEPSPAPPPEQDVRQPYVPEPASRKGAPHPSPSWGTSAPVEPPAAPRDVQHRPGRSGAGSGLPVEGDQDPSPKDRTPLSEYLERHGDASLAMARAYQSGDYRLGEIAEHFGVPASSVKRAADQHCGG